MAKMMNQPAAAPDYCNIEFAHMSLTAATLTVWILTTRSLPEYPNTLWNVLKCFRDMYLDIKMK